MTLNSLVEEALRTLNLLTEMVMTTLNLPVEATIEVVILSGLFYFFALSIEDPLKLLFYINMQLCIGLIIINMLLLA